MSNGKASIADSYVLSRNLRLEFALPGYSTPKTPIPFPKAFSVQRGKKCDIFPFLKDKSGEPSPTHYADGHQKFLKSSWTKPSGKFSSSKKITITDKIQSSSKSSPGPAKYSTISQSSLKRSLGKFGKSEPRTFLNNTTSLAEEVPGPNEYFKQPELQSKAFSFSQRRAPCFQYHKENPKKTPEKNPIGPGYLKELESSFNKKSLRNKTPDPIFLKEKRVFKMEKEAEKQKFVPGVGSYKNVESAFKKNLVKKERSVFTAKEKLVRSTERASKDKKWVPGPGSYNFRSFIGTK